MKYKCKVLTPEFIMKVRAFLKIFTKGADQPHWEKTLKMIWSNQIDYKEMRATIESKYPGLCTPEYKERVFESFTRTPSAKTVITNGEVYKPRIKYGEDILKIEDIFEIIEYQIVEPKTEPV